MAKTFTCTLDYPVVATTHGKLRGFEEGGVIKFYGIKYADAKRWQMPTEVADWEGVKEAYGYGYVCPMLNQDVPGAGEMKVPHRYWPLDENCQYLNVWTRSIEPGVKKPVMFWIHGGGYSAGSSIEQIAYDGANLATYGDVVVVSVNHRLNILGYMDVSAYGEEYYNSANVGNADMVMALKWVHENIAAFGGDPENVTIFGQSGGGAKVCALMQTPSAQGYIHKAIMMSGVRDAEQDQANIDPKPIVEALLNETGCATVQELAVLPYAALAEAYKKVSPEIAKAGGYVGGNGPIKNDWYAGIPTIYGWTEYAKNMPLMIGTVLDEFKGFAPSRPDRNTMTAEEARAMVEEDYGEDTDEIIELFQKNYPGKNLCDLMAIDTMFRPKSINLARSKAEAGGPVYTYMFAYDFPLGSGNGPWHCSDIPFAFHNIELVPVCNNPGIAEQLEHRYSAAYTNFAKYGNPNDPSLPAWPATTADQEACMIFDTDCEVRYNHDHEIIKLAMKHAGGPLKIKVEH